MKSIAVFGYDSAFFGDAHVSIIAPNWLVGAPSIQYVKIPTIICYFTVGGTHILFYWVMLDPYCGNDAIVSKVGATLVVT